MRTLTQDQVQASHEALRFFAAPGEPCTTGFYLLVGLQTTCVVHMILRDVLFCQPDYIPENSISTLAWEEPPIAAPSTPPSLSTPLKQRTPS
jgi:hypothetical protein